MITRNSIQGKFPIKTLGEIADFLDSRRKPITAEDRIPGPYPYYGANGQQDSVAGYIFDEPLVLLAEDGGLFDQPDRGIAYSIEGKTWVNNHAHVLRPKSCADLRFILRVLQNYDVTPWITGSTRAKLTKAGASNIEIPLPPLAEQKRIARILDAADALRTKRREALAQLDALLQSTFLTLFGDPVTNPMGWEESTIDALVENIDSGWSPTCLDRPAKDEEWGVLKLGAVTYCVYREDQTKALPSDLTPRPEIEVQKGDLLFARKNTYELVAACAYVHQTRPRLMLPDLIFRLRLSKASKAEPIFMWQQLIVPRLRKHIQSFAGGAAGSMPNISKAKLRSIEVILPPLSLQQKFARIVESVERQKAAQRAHLAELDALFASLQYRAFRGELSDSK